MFGEDTTMAARKQRQFDSAIERDGRSTHPQKVVFVYMYYIKVTIV